MHELQKLFFDEKTAVSFLVEHGIIKTERLCECGNLAILKIERKTYRCGRYGCKKEVSCFSDSFFSNARIPCNRILFAAYLWLGKASHAQISTFTGISEQATTDYMRHFRQLVADSLDDIDFVIGGEGIKVQIDESKFGKRKYHRGHRVDGVWIIGGVEKTPERKLFLRIIESRDAITLRKIIMRHVRCGSIIITDCWRGYLNLEELGYTHLSVNHTENFVNPLNGACTNDIEGKILECSKGVNSTEKQNLRLHEEFMVIYLEAKKRNKFVGRLYCDT